MVGMKMLRCINMRTTIDFPDELYRSLKARAATGGVTLKTLLLRLVELGLRQLGQGRPPTIGRREPPPVIIPPRGEPLRALSAAELRRLEEEDDEARDARSSGR